MYSKAKIGKKPIHPMLVAFPITLYLLTFVSFLVYQTLSVDIFWFKLAYFANYSAVVMAVLAAIPGFIDWAFGVPQGTQAKKDGAVHLTLNLVTLAIFAVNAFLIRGTWEAPLASVGLNLLLTGIGSLFLLGAGFYGWLMVSRHKVGIEMDVEQQNIQDRYEREKRGPSLFH